MNEFLNFLKDNWQFLTAIFVSVITSIVIWLIKKKPVLNKVDNILLAILENLPGIINGCEQLPKNEKKETALLLVKAFVKKQFNIELPDSYLALAGNWIEAILTTPQKKEAQL